MRSFFMESFIEMHQKYGMQDQDVYELLDTFRTWS